MENKSCIKDKVCIEIYNKNDELITKLDNLKKKDVICSKDNIVLKIKDVFVDPNFIDCLMSNSNNDINNLYSIRIFYSSSDIKTGKDVDVIATVNKACLIEIIIPPKFKEISVINITFKILNQLEHNIKYID